MVRYFFQSEKGGAETLMKLKSFFRSRYKGKARGVASQRQKAQEMILHGAGRRVVCCTDKNDGGRWSFLKSFFRWFLVRDGAFL